MTNLRKSLVAISFMGAAGLLGCSKDLDINTDPVRPATASPDLVLPTGIINVAYIMGGSLNIQGNFFAQHWTESLLANQYKDYDRYRIGQSTNDDEYSTLFTGGLKNLRYVIDRAKGDSANYSAIAGLQSAYTYQVLADAFDKVPFSESLQGAANTKPKFDEGPAIYDGLVTLINSSMARAKPGGVNVGAQDIVFGGDMDKWRRFGNTLKLKIFLRQVYARPTVAADSIRRLYARNAAFLGPDENAQVAGFSSASQNGNPFYLADVAASSSVSNNVIASQTIIGYLNSTNDPRIDDLFSRPTAAGITAHVGTAQGAAIGGGTDDNTKKSRPNLVKIAAADSPVIFLSGAESQFLQAEAALRGFATGATDKSLYEAGIAASFSRLGRALPATFLTSTSIAYNATGTLEQRLEQIITQKWVSMSGTEGFEMWTELRRTKYPSFITGTPYSDLPGRTYAKRLIYPISESTRNPNTPAVLGAEVPVWWDRK